MRYSLRTLLIVMLLAGPLGAYVWSRWGAYREWKAQQSSKSANTSRSPALVRPGCRIIINNSLELSEFDLLEIKQHEAMRAAERKDVEALVKKLSNEPLPDE